MWKTRVFTVVCLALGYRFNPDRPNGRWLKKEDGEPKNWYLLVPTEGEMKVSEGIKTNAEHAAEEAPPVVKNGKFAGFLFGEED